MDEPAAVTRSSTRASFDLLGPLRVVVDGAPARLGGPRQVAVLGRLVLSPGRVVSMDELVDSVWDGEQPSRPEVAIRSYVSNLRRSIEPDRDRGDRRSCIESSPPGYRLAVSPDQVDAHRFESLLEAGRRSLAEKEPEAAVAGFVAAQRLWRGEVCEGLTETDALLAFRSRLDELRLAAVELTFEARLELGEHETVIPDLEAAVTAHPLRERLTELAMVALYQSGRQSDALAACRQLRSRLIDQLGVTPGRRIEDLEHRILTHDPTLMPRARAAVGLERPDVGPALGPALGAVVGRDDELRSLGVIDSALAAGRGATVLVTGEPGSGKTALVSAHLDSRCDSAVVAWGRCRPMAADRALWPWDQLLDGLGSHVDDATLSGLDDLAPSPSLATGGVDPAHPTTMFGPIVEFLDRISARVPVVLVLDDAQWADQATIELVSFVGTALACRPLGLVVTWRHTENGAPIGALRPLARLPNAVRIELDGLDRNAVDELVDGAGVGGRPLARRLHVETAGNPLYLRELLDDAASRSDIDDEVQLRPTAGLRDAILDRVERAHPQAPTILTTAALHRNRFTPEVLAEVSELQPATVEEAVDCLVHAGLITEDAGHSRAYRFVHPIAAATLAAEVTGPKAARLHAAIGRAMWRQDSPATDMAFHFALAGSVGTSILAARFVLEAAKAPLALSDLVGLERIVEQGLDALETLDHVDPLASELCAFLAQTARLTGSPQRFVDRGRMALAIAGRCDDETAASAAALAATGAGPGPAFARASWVGLGVDPAGPEEAIEARLEAASGDDPLAAALELRAGAGSPGPTPRRRSRRWRSVSADDLGDGQGRLAIAFETARLALTRGPTPARVVAADELEAVAAAVRGRSVIHERLLALQLRVLASAERGDRQGLEAHLAAARRIVPDAGEASPLTTAHLGLAALETAADLAVGRLASAESTLDWVRSACRHAGLSSAAFDRQLLALRWEQGKFGEFDELLARGVGAFDPLTGSVLASLASFGQGDGGRGRALLDALLDDESRDAGALRHLRVDVVALLAVAAYHGRHPALAKLTLGALLPRRAGVVTSADGLVLMGPVAYHAGLAAAAAGRAGLADELLAQSEQLARDLEAGPWLARALVARSELLHGREGPTGSAEALRAEAFEIAVELGLGALGASPASGPDAGPGR